VRPRNVDQAAPSRWASGRASPRPPGALEQVGSAEARGDLARSRETGQSKPGRAGAGHHPAATLIALLKQILLVPSRPSAVTFGPPYAGAVTSGQFSCPIDLAFGHLSKCDIDVPSRCRTSAIGRASAALDSLVSHYFAANIGVDGDSLSGHRHVDALWRWRRTIGTGERTGGGILGSLRSVEEDLNGRGGWGALRRCQGQGKPNSSPSPHGL
jgi:hypothetical protein